MSMMGAQLVAKVSVEGDAEAKQKLQGVSDKAKETSGGFKEMLTHGLEITGVFAAFDLAKEGVRMLGDQIGDVIKVTEAHQLVAAQMVQVLKSTRDVSGMTADALDNLAQSFSKTTMFSADTVLGGENLLLTFTNIGKSVFPQATQAILDVSQAMGQDLKSSAIQVGKALGDPLTGMTALQRIGVTFSASEKEQIKTMMAHNDIIGAQKIILHELSTEFGGSATAAGKTFGGQLKILQDRFEELKIKIGEKVMPVLTTLLNWFSTTALPGLQRFGDFLGSKLGPAFQALGGFIQTVVGYLQGEQFAGVIADFQTLGTEIEQHVAPVLQRLMPILQQIGGFFQSAFSQIGPLLTNVVIPAIDNVVFFIGALLSGIKPADPIFKGVWNVFMQLGKVLQDVGGFLQSTFAPVWQQLVTVWTSQILPSLKQLWSALQPLLPVLQAIGGIILGVVVVAMGVLVGVIGGLLKALAGWLSGVAVVIGGVVQLFTGVVQVISGIVTFIY